MSKWLPDAALDTLLDYLAGCNVLTLNSMQPTTYSNATGSTKLAHVTLSSGDYTKANGIASGRRVTVAAKTGISILATGYATHLAGVNTNDYTLRFVVVCTRRLLTSGGTTTTTAFDIEIGDPM